MFGYILLTPPAINLVVRRARASASRDVPEHLPPSLARFALDDIHVDDILDRRRGYPDPSLSVRAFADRWIVPHQQDYVIAEKGEVAGIVSLGMLRYVPKESWATTPLGRIVRRNPPVARPEEPVEDVLQRMSEKLLHRAAGGGARVREVRGRDHQPGDPRSHHQRSPRRTLNAPGRPARRHASKPVDSVHSRRRIEGERVSVRLEGKSVLITGATSGIGAQCARAFAREGAKLMLTAAMPNGARRCWRSWPVATRPSCPATSPPARPRRAWSPRAWGDSDASTCSSTAPASSITATCRRRATPSGKRPSPST